VHPCIRGNRQKNAIRVEPKFNIMSELSKIFNIAILGCGKVAHLHAKAISEIPNARLGGVWSRSQSSAESFAKHYSTVSYPSVTELVKTEKIDLAIVCTPHPFHVDPTTEAALSGAHVLVEKPLAVSLEDCDRMIEVCRSAGVKLGVISQRRWYAPVMRVKEAIDSGKIGAPALGTVTMLGWRDRAYYEADAWRGTWDMEGGGVLVNQAPHQLDLLLWFMGEIDEVYGIWKNLNHPYIEVEDTALAIIKFKSGAIGNIIVSNSQKPGIYGKVHVHGTNGASVGVQTDGGAMFIAGMSGILEPPVNDLWSVPGEENLLEQWKKEDGDFFQSIDPMVYYMKMQIADFLEALQTGREPLVGATDGRRVAQLFNAIYQSTLENRPVKVN
jgi:UDP-N-acetyl-2-amino-2-deoxyglucuronate dehydrogenase